MVLLQQGTVVIRQNIGFHGPPCNDQTILCIQFLRREFFHSFLWLQNPLISAFYILYRGDFIKTDIHSAYLRNKDPLLSLLKQLFHKGNGLYFTPVIQVNQHPLRLLKFRKRLQIL